MKKQFIKEILWLVALAGFVSAAAGQSVDNFAITWSTFDGSGGGAITGGFFSLNGSVGQPDAGAMRGGAFSLAGGFWPGISNGNSRPVSGLSIRLAGGNNVVLFWPNPSTGYVLQQMNAPAGAWIDVSQTPVINGANKEVTLPAVGQASFFRLRKL